jgi:hypothetical protein
MTPMPEEDVMTEGLWDLFYKTCPPDGRKELIRFTLRVALYKEQQIRQQAMERANAKRIDARAQLKATTRASGENRSVVGDGGLVLSPVIALEGETQ